MKHTGSTILKKIYYDYLPDSLRKYYGPKVEKLYSILNRLYSIISDLYGPVTCLTGCDVGNPSQLRILIAGRDGSSRCLLKNLNLHERETTDRTRQGKRCLWNVPKMNTGSAHALLIEADRCFSPFLRTQGFITIPNWVFLTLDISMPKENILERYKKRNGANYQKIMKCQYTYEAVRDPNLVELFYYRMYLPYVKSRHGELVFTDSFPYINNLMQYGELILVKEGSEYVGGFIINTASSRPVLAYIGVLDGREDCLRNGLSPAIYYFAICWAKENGYTKLDFGHCSPLLNDGILKFKRQWGMCMHRSPRVFRALHLLLCKSSTSLKQFLVNNPVVCEDHGQLKGLFFLDHDASQSESLVEDLKKKYAMPGLTEFSVITVNDESYSPLMREGV